MSSNIIADVDGERREDCVECGRRRRGRDVGRERHRRTRRSVERRWRSERTPLVVHVWRPPPLPLPVADDAQSHEQSQGASAERQDQHGGGFFDDHSNTFVRPIKEKDIIEIISLILPFDRIKWNTNNRSEKKV